MVDADLVLAGQGPDRQFKAAVREAMTAAAGNGGCAAGRTSGSHGWDLTRDRSTVPRRSGPPGGCPREVRGPASGHAFPRSSPALRAPRPRRHHRCGGRPPRAVARVVASRPSGVSRRRCRASRGSRGPGPSRRWAVDRSVKQPWPVRPVRPEAIRSAFRLGQIDAIRARIAAEHAAADAAAWPPPRRRPPRRQQRRPTAARTTGSVARDVALVTSRYTRHAAGQPVYRWGCAGKNNAYTSPARV
jgi:hypothetical protein